jgi:2-polyprenyl-6-methoxyphenol hydroxylase-like FAD-dependent oxidoreductase
VQSSYDVAIVGYGPVGQLAAILLGRAGHRVGVFERWPSLYPRPRAVHYDDEVARIFQAVGLADRLGPITEPATTYEWKSAHDETLLLLDRSRPGPSGWPAATMFTQPQLEALLDETAKGVASVDVHQGWEVADVKDTGANVRVSVRGGVLEGGEWVPSGEERELVADYVIGCDGANSIVRERMGTRVEDLGFAFDWLIADTIPHDPTLLAGVNLQRCDPARPTTLVSGGPARRRWEWMLLEGETRAQVEDEQFVWGLLEKSGVGKDDVALERHIVYTFRARWAERWRVGRMLLAGDAAHLMPPFAGQGMCSGMRDAFTLSWQLDLVLKGAAGYGVLDAYSSERCGHVQSAIALSVELGKVMCITDGEQAAARDEALLSAAADAGAQAIEPPVPLLGPGLRDDGAPGAGDPGAASSPATAGSLFPQALARIGGRTCLLEDAIDASFILYVLDSEVESAIDPDVDAYLRGLGGTTVKTDDALDVTGAYRAWFAAHDCIAALVRPDFYVFGTAARGEDPSALVRRLQRCLTTPSTSEERPAR